MRRGPFYLLTAANALKNRPIPFEFTTENCLLNAKQSLFFQPYVSPIRFLALHKLGRKNRREDLHPLCCWNSFFIKI